LTWDAFIRFARVYNSNLLDGPPRFTGTLYARGSLRFKPADLDIPLVVDHDINQEIGRVRKIDEIKDVDGRWYVALATVTRRPAWLRRHTGASFEAKPLATMEVNGWRIVQRALVTEVTVTSPTHEPRDVGAKVLLLDAMPEPKRAAGNREGEPTRGSGIIRRSERANALLDDEELRRRLDYAAARGLRVDTETVIRNLQREINGGPSLDEVYAEWVTRAA
jgi:hypothetical protein